MKNFGAECTCDGVVVATGLARYIRRERMRHEFWEEMEEAGHEMGGVAYHVFDRYGTVQIKYKDHPVQRGTGIWGNELDHGPLFLIEKLHITAIELRRKGLGRKVVSLLLNKAKQFCLDEKKDVKHADSLYGFNEAFERAWTLHALVSPGILTVDLKAQFVGKSAEERVIIRDRLHSGTINFWRSCGFRRIGASHWFAFSFNPQHQSRTLTAGSDFDPHRSYAKDLESEEFEAIFEMDPFTEAKKLEVERLRAALPLHYAALTLTDEELQAFFVTHTDDTNNEIDWDRVTNSEATLLHLTACEMKPLSTRWLLEIIHQADSWKRARDINGYTPFEALQEKLEVMRTRKEYGLYRVLNLSDSFKGNPETAVPCLSLLAGEDLGINRACLRYGCTCGECVGGFLSSRMRSSLIFQAETICDIMGDRIDNGGLWVEWNYIYLEYLEPDVRKNLETNESLRKSFVNVFQITTECLKAKKVPTAENLERDSINRGEWPPHTKNSLRGAGTRMGDWAVVRSMFDAAKENDEKAGNGECQLILDKEWSDLPTCRNDHEFEFVATICGYSRDSFMSLPY